MRDKSARIIAILKFLLGLRIVVWTVAGEMLDPFSLMGIGVLICLWAAVDYFDA